MSHIWSLICLPSIVIIRAPNSTPIVRSWTGWKRLSVNWRRRQDFPTPKNEAAALVPLVVILLIFQPKCTTHTQPTYGSGFLGDSHIQGGDLLIWMAFLWARDKGRKLRMRFFLPEGLPEARDLLCIPPRFVMGSYTVQGIEVNHRGGNHGDVTTQKNNKDTENSMNIACHAFFSAFPSMWASSPTTVTHVMRPQWSHLPTGGTL